MIALLADLQSKGLLDQTLVVGTEFGRTARVNDDDWREHHHKAFMRLLAGADTHSDNFEGTPQQAAVLNHAIGDPLVDPQAKGLLDQTLVVLGSEFGRTPRINDNDGGDSA